MSQQKPSAPRGMRDFGPDEMFRRNYIFSIIRQTYEKFGFLPLETPAMEKLETLTGKYGEEGDRLIFKVLNSGDFLKSPKDKGLDLNQTESSNVVKYICDRAMRYDLTVPFARYVVQYHHQLTFPFKRYQIQPVW
ncbi:MAG: histidine--tRNA ligase, partial [Flavobacteriales bacterium]|nr:histidine--tRNA ligase [Flavobacteriales bacterium]